MVGSVEHIHSKIRRTIYFFTYSQARTQKNTTKEAKSRKSHNIVEQFIVGITGSCCHVGYQHPSRPDFFWRRWHWGYATPFPIPACHSGRPGLLFLLAFFSRKTCRLPKWWIRNPSNMTRGKSHQSGANYVVKFLNQDFLVFFLGGGIFVGIHITTTPVMVTGGELWSP